MPDLHAALNRYYGRLLALSALTSFVMMDLFAQYLMVIDPIDPVSIMLLRMVPSTVFAYAYLWKSGYEALPFGPRDYWAVLAVRSCMVWGSLTLFYTAIRHIRWVRMAS
jgi:drug/metabolite transporter (DMT)-like permease